MAEQKINLQQQKPNVPKLVQLDLPEQEEFNNVISVLTTPSVKIEKKIAELFSSIFADFDGCKIIQGPINEPLKCKLYFKPCMNKGDGLYAVKVRGEDIKAKKQSSFSAMVNTVNMLYNSKQFDLEDIAKEILAGFVYAPDANVVDRYDEELGKVVKVRLPKNWNPYLEEVTDVIANTRFQNPYLVVTVDLTLLISKLFGKKDLEEVKALKPRGITPKDNYQYSVSVVKNLNPSTRSYILEIRRIDIKALEELSQSIGYGAITGSIVMTRA